MAKPQHMELGEGRNITRIPILYEDRSVMAIDKPAGWLLVPFSWQRTQRNLQAAVTSSISAGHFWARSRNLKFLRHVHRLDGDTSGILLFAKSLGAVDTYSDLFETRQMEKTYLVVVHGVPKQTEWTCTAKLASDPQQVGRMRVDNKEGKDCETSFRVRDTNGTWSLVEAFPVTGRTHQIRVHLLDSGHAVVGDDYYGPDAGDGHKHLPPQRTPYPLGLRAATLAYFDPFLRKNTRIKAPMDDFITAFGFQPPPKPTKPEARTGPHLKTEN
ncbi:MAG TPA: RluA family pseudouridine synthase [Verrucomicrobiae bacterium]